MIKQSKVKQQEFCYEISAHSTLSHWAVANGLSQFDGQTWRTYTATDGLADNAVLTIAIDSAGHKWFGTWGGLREFDDNP